ncbi:MAG TPA: hypothetical protein P5513_03780, partial [Candidatus Diapherotrites archaeon]|nr:hypothetical protein [Candidatus Diapherotrites archaeon]
EGTPEEQLKWSGITNNQIGTTWIGKNLANNLFPAGYSSSDNTKIKKSHISTVKRVYNAGIKNKIEPDRFDINDAIEYPEDSHDYSMNDIIRFKDRVDYNNLYFGLPQKYNTKRISKYKPSITKDGAPAEYYTSDLIQQRLKQLLAFDDFHTYRSIQPGDISNTGNYTLGSGEDDRGKYYSFYDIWDLSPFGTKGDESMKIGKPIELYDRIYYKDYETGRKQMYYSDKELSELDVNKKNFDTRALQIELSNRGYKLPKSTKKDGSFDGVWGDETKNALLDWQNKNLRTSQQKYQQGGTAGMDGMMKARLAIDSHFGNPTAKRMTNYDTRYYEFPDGNKGNVYVSSYDNLVTPQIQDVNGKLMFIDNPWSKENADRSYNQSMKFEREEDARYFGENYKKYAPMTNLYKKQEGGEMNEEIIMKIREALQQGMTPEQIVKELQKQGITEQEAIQLVSAAIPQQEEMQQYQYGTTVRHNYADNINFDNKFNATALGLNAVSDPRNMIWALPDTGFGSGLKAISGLASGLAGSYLGYAKLFSKDKIHVQDPKEKPIVSSPYIPEGKDVTKVVKPVSDLPPNWDWQTWNKQIENPYKTQIFKEANYQKGGMKKYQQGDRVMDMTSMNQMNPEFLNPEAFNITFNSMYPYLNNTQSFTTTQQEQNKPYNYNEDYGRYKQYLDNFAKQDFSQISEEKQNKKEKQNKPEGDSTITSMNDDALGFIIANNALIGFQNFNDVLSARDYEKEYNQMLMRTGNSDQRYNAINPTNPYGMYTPNAGIGSNYGLVANSHIQDFGTSMASAKYGGMKKKYKEGG